MKPEELEKELGQWKEDSERGAKVSFDKLSPASNEEKSEEEDSSKSKKGFCIDCGKKCSGKRCKECYLKVAGKKFEFGKWKFNSQKQLNITIKTILSESPRNMEFENEFFKELINKYHQGVLKAGLKVTKFKILTFENQIGKWSFAQERYRGGILIIGFFEPINKWHGVTVYPHKKNTVRQKLIFALRQKWAESMEFRDVDAKCVECGGYYPQHHHKNITFKEIAEECLKEFSEDEIKYGLGQHWWLHENEADALDNDHPAVIKMFELHKDVEYELLCGSCHLEKKDGDTKTITN